MLGLSQEKRARYVNSSSQSIRGIFDSTPRRRRNPRRLGFICHQRKEPVCDVITDSEKPGFEDGEAQQTRTEVWYRSLIANQQLTEFMQIVRQPKALRSQRPYAALLEDLVDQPHSNHTLIVC